MSPIDIIDVDEANFDIEVLQVSESLPVVVDFWAEWCQPCKILTPILIDLIKQGTEEIRLAKVNVDHNPNLAIRYNVRGIPAVKIFRNREIIAEFTGLRSVDQIRKIFEEITPHPTDLLLGKGNSLLKNQDWEQAEETFRSILTERKEYPPALVGLAKALLGQGVGSEALTILRNFPPSREFSQAERLIPLAEALESTPSSTFAGDSDLDVIFNRAINLIRKGNYPAAIDGLLDILRTDKGYRNGRPKEIILGLFELLGDDNHDVHLYRKELASILF